MKTSLTAATMHGGSWPCGATTTIRSGRIPHWATKHRDKRAERSSNLRPPRPARLRQTGSRNTEIQPADPRYKRATRRGQVKRTDLQRIAALRSWSNVQPPTEPVVDDRPRDVGHDPINMFGYAARDHVGDGGTERGLSARGPLQALRPPLRSLFRVWRQHGCRYDVLVGPRRRTTGLAISLVRSGLALRVAP